MADSLFPKPSSALSNSAPSGSAQEASTAQPQGQSAAPSRPLWERSAPEQVAWLSGKLAIATLILMAIGSATRVMNAGLACPDWPLCYGTLLPAQQMNLQVFLEWFHRLDASIVGFGTITLLGLSLWKRRDLPRWVPSMAGLSLFLVVFQGMLGALTVTQLLRFDLVTAHLGTALLFFSTLLSLSMLLRPYPAVGPAESVSAEGASAERVSAESLVAESPVAKSAVGRLRWVGVLAVGLVYAQSILGGLVASRWALHQCLAGGQLCTVMNSHLLGVVPATVATVTLVVWSGRSPTLSNPLRRLALAAGSALVLQASLGFLALKLHLQIELLTVAHQTVGATLLGILLAFTVLAWRDHRATLQTPTPAN